MNDGDISQRQTLADAYDAAFACRAGDALTLRPETTQDAAFLRDLFIACSPLDGVLPGFLLEQQADMQQTSQMQARPNAMRRIILSGGDPVGRIILDWSEQGQCYGVDIAVLPDARQTGAGPAMLRAWLDVADAAGVLCTLDVFAGNAARHFYRRLGFSVTGGTEGSDAVLFMQRPPRPR